MLDLQKYVDMLWALRFRAFSNNDMDKHREYVRLIDICEDKLAANNSYDKFPSVKV